MEGDHDIPFEFELPETVVESFHGSDASVEYSLEAVLRRGTLSRDLRIIRMLRILRASSPNSPIEGVETAEVATTWPNKVDYWVCVFPKYAAFGQTIKLNMRFTPLLKGLEMGNVTVRLFELRNVHMQTWSGSSTSEPLSERLVLAWQFDVSCGEHWREALEDMDQEGWVFSKSLDLLKGLQECTQDLSQYGITVRHELRLEVELKNPKGHISRVIALLPIVLFIPPGAVFDNDGAVTNPLAGLVTEHDAAISPPSYGEHMYDYRLEDVGADGAVPVQITPHLVDGGVQDRNRG